MSASSASPRVAKRATVVIVRIVASGPTSVSNWAPMRASASFTWSAVRPPAPSSSMSPVSDASPGSAAGSVGGPDAEQQDEGDDRHRAMLHGPHAEPVRQLPLGDAREMEHGIGPEFRQARAVDARHRTTTGSEPAIASSVLPRGTTLSVTRRSVMRYRRTWSRSEADGRLLVAREVAVEVPGLAQEHGVRVQLVGLAAEPADRLQPVDELRLRLREAALELVFGRPGRRQGRDLLGHDLLELRERVAWRGSHDHLEEARQLARVLERRDLSGHAPRVDERVVQARVLPVRQHVGNQIQFGVARREHRRRVPRQIQARQFDAIFVQQAHRAVPSSELAPHRSDAGPAGTSPKYALTRSSASSALMSPAMASEALPGW